MNENKLTHFDENGNANMVDVSKKDSTLRVAMATGIIECNDIAYKSIKEGTNKKGDVLKVAEIAGIMSAKKTSDLIPLCHNINLTGAKITFELAENKVIATAVVKTKGVTGVEMEALTAVSVALLTIYDMCKAVDKEMVIKDVCLVEKSGGKSGDFRRSK